MGFIDKMSSILSNDGLNILKANTDNFKKHGSDYLKARGNVNYQRDLNHKLPGSTEQTYLDEMQRVSDKRDTQIAYGRGQRALGKTTQQMAMAKAERERLKSAHANESMRGKDGKLNEEGYKHVAGEQRQALLGHITNRTEARNALLNEGKDYFIGGNWKENSARIGAATAAVGTVAVGTRYMSGGSVGYNNQGRRDIAGIPFI